jgi:carbonic anhydrase/acetyltransferase-like protein (isoleucine patch superfamily)
MVLIDSPVVFCHTSPAEVTTFATKTAAKVHGPLSFGSRLEKHEIHSNRRAAESGAPHPKSAAWETSMILPYKGQRPRIGKNVFIAPTAVLIGDVDIADGASIWYGAVLRGDMDAIRIGRNTNVQENCTLHTDFGHPVHIAADVTIGHNVVVHACTIEDGCLIGLGALLLTDALIRRGSLVAAGTVVKEGQVVGPDSLIAGVPARVKRPLTADEKNGMVRATQIYLELAAEHMQIGEGLPPCK